MVAADLRDVNEIKCALSSLECYNKEANADKEAQRASHLDEDGTEAKKDTHGDPSCLEHSSSSEPDHERIRQKRAKKARAADKVGLLFWCHEWFEVSSLGQHLLFVNILEDSSGIKVNDVNS